MRTVEEQNHWISSFHELEAVMREKRIVVETEEDSFKCVVNRETPNI